MNERRPPSSGEPDQEHTMLPFSRRHWIRRITYSVASAALVATSMAACRTAPETAPEAAVTALVVRNTSLFDVGVFALVGDERKPVWLGTAPPSSVRSFALYPSNLGPRQSLVVETRAGGSSRVWHSTAMRVTDDMVPVLDIRGDAKGATIASALNSVTLADFAFIMR
jgi:hypothetical protein